MSVERAKELMMQNDEVGALKCINEHLLDEPEDWFAHLMKGGILLHLREFTESVASFDHVIQNTYAATFHLRSYCGKGDALIQIGVQQNSRVPILSAVEMYEKAVAFDAKDPQPYVGLAQAYAVLGDAGEVSKHCEMAENLNPAVREFTQSLRASVGL